MKKIIVTVGPSFLQSPIIEQYHSDRYIYRINGSHGTILDVEYAISIIRSQVPHAEILIDLPGNKIRTANLTDPIYLLEGKPFFLTREQFNFLDFYQYVKKGDQVFANDCIFNFTIDEVTDSFIKFISNSNGELHNNKGIFVQGVNEKLPFLFQKDFDLIDLINAYSIEYVGLSFVRNQEDILLAREKIRDSIPIVKIETIQAVRCLDEILDLSDYILVDRGDLSTHVGLTNIAYYQRFISEKALHRNIKIFLATQFLKTMEYSPIPTIAEIIDLTNTLKGGIYGIQLSEEIAIGKYPVKCLELIHEIEKSIRNEKIA